MPKQITQAELVAVLDHDESLNRKLLGIRRRLERGAQIEPGKLTGEADRYSHDFSTRCSGLYAMGLDLGPADDAMRIDHKTCVPMGNLPDAGLYTRAIGNLCRFCTPGLETEWIGGYSNVRGLRMPSRLLSFRRRLGARN